MVSWVTKGLWKLDPEASEDCCRLWELDVKAGAARREDEDEEDGRVCRVQLRRAEPADAGTGRIVDVDVCVDRGKRWWMRCWGAPDVDRTTGCRDVAMLSFK